MGLFVFVLFVACAYSRKTDAIFTLETSKGNERLEAILMDISNHKSPNYGQFLSSDEIKKVVGLDASVLQRVASSLRKIGFSDVAVSGHDDHLRGFGEPIPMAEILRRSPSLRGVLHSVHYKEDEKPRKSSGLTRRQAFKAHYNKKGKRQGPLGDPNSQRASYGIPSSQSVTFQNNTGLVWGPGTYGFLSSDLAQFYSENNVNSNPNNVQTIGFQGVPGGDNFGECSLDVQYSTGIGNNLNLQVSNTNTSQSTEEGNGFGYAFYDFALNLASESTVPGVVSLSLGSLSAYACDTLCTYANSLYGIGISECNNYLQNQRQICMMDSQPQETAISTQLMKLGARGTTIVAAAGDGGSHFSFVMFPDDRIGRALNKVSCSYNFPTFPASSPWVLAVGGTQWSGAPSPSQPIAWSSGGSGFAWQFSMPSYQSSVVKAYLSAQSSSSGFPAPGSFNPNGRAYPDVAALADNIPMVEQGQDQSTGGTSASAPEWAGVIALINDIRISKGLPFLGFLNTRLYAQAGAGIFDVTVGNSRCAINGCCDSGFPAATGWDAMTGWGSPVWSALLNAFGSD